MSRSKVLQRLPIPSFLTQYSQQSHPFRHSVSAGVGVGFGRSFSKLSRVQPFSGHAMDLTTRYGAPDYSLSVGVDNNNNRIAGFDAHLYTSG